MDLLSSAFKILEAIQQSSNPRKFVNEFVSYDNKKKELKIFDTRYNITGNLYILSVGKAAVSMTEALLEILKDNFDHGIIVIPHEYTFSNPKFEVYNSGHPLPDENGIMASKKILSFVENTNLNDIIICLLSGGGSALLPYPEDDLTLKDKIKTTRLLLECGAKIEEINTVRKHLSKIKGGKLAAKAKGTLLTLVLSDVPAGSTTCIASGPTVADPTTFKDAFEILSKYDLLESIPKNVLTHIKKGEKGLIEESPKQVDSRHKTYIIGSNIYPLEATLEQAKKEGFNSMLLTSTMEGEAREIAHLLASISKEIKYFDRPIQKPAAIICGGETTVKVKGKGKGGRNQEAALSFLIDVKGLEDLLILTYATDGRDGQTDAAGVIATGQTYFKAIKNGLNPVEFLKNNDSYTFFDRMNLLIKTTPTHTNLNDIFLILVN